MGSAPFWNGSMDYMAEQMLPIDKWGYKFALVPSPNRENPDLFRYFFHGFLHNSYQ